MKESIRKISVALFALMAFISYSNAQIVRSVSSVNREHIVSENWKAISVDYLPVVIAPDVSGGLAINYSETNPLLGGYFFWEWGVGFQYSYGEKSFGSIKAPIKLRMPFPGSDSFFIDMGLELRYNLFNNQLRPLQLGFDMGFKLRLKEKFLLGVGAFFDSSVFSSGDVEKDCNAMDVQLSFGICF